MGNNDREGITGGNPGHIHPGMVSSKLCLEARAHMGTKIDNMEKSIRWSVYLATAGMGVLIMLFEWYLKVIL